jgi:hypothetical protein
MSRDLAAALVSSLDDDEALGALADLLVPLLRDRISTPARSVGDRWLDSRSAAAHVGLTYNAFRKYQHIIPSEQASPGGKRWYRPEVLDAWRRG